MTYCMLSYAIKEKMGRFWEMIFPLTFPSFGDVIETGVPINPPKMYIIQDVILYNLHKR